MIKLLIDASHNSLQKVASLLDKLHVLRIQEVPFDVSGRQGYLEFNSPFDFNVRQYGVIFFFPFCLTFLLLHLQKSMQISPVIGQLIVALYLSAIISRILFIVMSFPLGTCLIISSTSLGKGIAQVPDPHLFALFFSYFNYCWKTLIIVKLFLPCFPFIHNTPRLLN